MPNKNNKRELNIPKRIEDFDVSMVLGYPYDYRDSNDTSQQRDGKTKLPKDSKAVAMTDTTDAIDVFLMEQSSQTATIVDDKETTEETPLSRSNQPEASEATKAADVIEVAEISDVDGQPADYVSPKDEMPQPKVSVPKDETILSTVKATRISAKMRKATRTEFCEAYAGKVDTKGGKPITITSSSMERLYRLCSLSGNHNACPTYVINNLLSEFLDAVEPEAKKWGMLD